MESQLSLFTGYTVNNTVLQFMAKIPQTHGIYRMLAENEKGTDIGEAWVKVVS